MQGGDGKRIGRQVFDEMPKRQLHWDKEARLRATRDLLRCIVDHRVDAKSVASCVRDAIINHCNQAVLWLRVRSRQQDSVSRSVEHVLWSNEIRRKNKAQDTV